MSLTTNRFCKILGNPQHGGKHLGLGFKILLTTIINIKTLSNNNILEVMAIIKVNINSIKNPNISNRSLNELSIWSRIGAPSYILDFLT